MVEKIVFTVITLILFIYIFLLKIIKKNDTTYFIILGMQSVGILINLIRISLGMFEDTAYTVLLYVFCIVIPITVILLEIKKINVSEILRIIMAKTCLLINKPKRAKKILVDLVSKYKESYLGHKMLASLYEKEGGMRKAIDEYVQALELKKNDFKTYYRISFLLKELGKKEESIEMLRKLLKNKPDMYAASEALGKIYIDNKEYKNAIEVYTSAAKNNPEKYEVYYNLGVCYSNINDFDIARKCFQKTVELNENMYIAYYRLGQIALLYRDFEVAEENFAKSLHNEKEAKSYIELAKIKMMKNAKREAALYVNTAIKIDYRYYEIAQKEPIFFPIKQLILEATNKTKPEFTETKQELELEAYLNNTYSLTKILNKQQERIKKKK